MKIVPFICSDEDRDEINWFIIRSTSWSFKLTHEEDIKKYETLCTKDFICKAVRYLREIQKTRKLNMWEFNFFERLNGSVPQYNPQ